MAGSSAKASTDSSGGGSGASVRSATRSLAERDRGFAATSASLAVTGPLVTAERLGSSPAEARALRSEVISSHVAVRGSQTRLRARVKELLGEARDESVSSETIASAVAKVDEMLEVDPADTRHLFWEEMKRLFFAMREVEREDLDDEILEEFLSAADGLSNVLYRLERRRAERHRREKEAQGAG